jgi:alpha-tubulin suppressor-like RCC1 family protein
VDVKNLTDAKAIAAGDYHSLALKENGTVWAWGMNDWGQLGIGPDPRPSYLPPSYVPVKVKNLTDAKAIAAGYGFSLALKKDGTVRAWGDNDSGQLGNGPRLTETTLPVDVKNLTDAKAIAAGDYHSLALKENGTVWAWGDNAVGQLGNATTLRSYVPVKVINLTDVKAIAASTSLSMALKE